jgi:putative exosortase-associated protein (TIGR04073 family)
MKMIIRFLLISLLAGSAVVQAAEIENEGTMLRKLQRGFLNIALSPIEVSNELSKEKRSDTFPPSWVAGLGRGACFMVGRALTGAYEMVTFPVPYPANYRPILKPEFAWQHLPEKS